MEWKTRPNLVIEQIQERVFQPMSQFLQMGLETPGFGGNTMSFNFKLVVDFQ